MSGINTHTAVDRALGGYDPLLRALDVVNAFAVEPHDDRAALTEILCRHGEREVLLTPDDVASLRAAAGALRSVLHTEDPDTAARLINDLLGRADSRPQLSNHDGYRWHLHLASLDADWGDWLLATGALALGLLMSRKGRCSWGRCAGCPRYYVHDGRGSVRRFCSTRCSTRARVAAHRRRS